MNRFLAGFFVLTLVIAGGYWYRFAESKCKIPVAYDVGTIDERFNISHDEVLRAISDAESLWEDATGKNLFTYTPDAKFRINFVFDERQEVANTQETARTELDTKEEASKRIRAEYERMVREYDTLKKSYESEVSAYEKALSSHNDEVEMWNTKGGAPKEEFDRLNTEQEQLTVRHQALNTKAKQMNDLASSINRLGDVGNETVEEYNTNVAWYNNLFGGEREFTQGEYQGDHINIYQFDDATELRRVLAHELGHALSLQHVDGAESVMHYLMEGKLSSLALSLEDIAEFGRVCGVE